MDLGRVVAALEERFGGKWVLFFRVHPQLAARHKNTFAADLGKRVIDVSKRPDINELIAASDCFLSDYSSAAFEAALADMPVFLYADDLAEYLQERGKLMFDLHKLPFPVAYNNDELIRNISSFSDIEYHDNLQQFYKRVGMAEDGHASERIADLVECFIKEGTT